MTIPDDICGCCYHHKGESLNCTRSDCDCVPRRCPSCKKQEIGIPTDNRYCGHCNSLMDSTKVLNKEYWVKKLQALIDDMDDYTPEDLTNALARLTDIAGHKAGYDINIKMQQY